MLNKVILIGRLGADPEVKQVNEKTVANLRIATDNGRGHTEWTDVVVWEQPAEYASKFLSKGRLVYVEGEKQTRSWENKDGEKRYKVEVKGRILLGLDRGKEGNDEEVPF